MNKKKNEKISILAFNPTEIISLAFIKNYLRIDNDNDDDFLISSLNTACIYAEKMMGKILGNKTFKLSIITNENIIKIEKENIFIKDVINVIVNNVTIPKDSFYIKNGILFFINPIYGQIDITFTAGLSSEEITNDIKQAMLYHIASIYQNKDGCFSIPQATTETYSMYRNVKL